ncbi:MAG: exopolysaccharide biosynthesis polyprenyl glycosylphosphotransferase [Paludibacter sp.]|nr:exopolysaccharide biosynthesis polyprenyl glycosylphosphotransferase [Paludibacter sp.]MDD4199169.1 exopolysaccharide biosynthesis polyprenyl glycosylphosphotransferase [Paludibacter sp.]MDD4428563.1 exopolysaccharide biosynthesis polyprenyl glycosylphosphotransferase [Paludibacter sp.]
MKTRENELQFISVVLDLLLLNLSFLLFAFIFYRFRFEHGIDIYLCHLLANFSWVLAFIFIRKRMLYLKKGFKTRLIRVFKRSLIFLLLATLLFLPFAPIIGYLWPYALVSCLFFVLSKLLINFIYFKTIKYYHLKNNRVKRVLLVGKNETMQKVKRIIKVNPILKYMFLGYLSDVPGKDVLGNLDELKEVVKKHNIHVVFVAIKSQQEIMPYSDINKELLHTCNQLGVRLFYVPENESIETGNFDLEKLNGISLINPQKIPMDQIENQIKKRMFDLIFSGMVIVLLLSWLYPILAILIKLSSKGPVLFTQKRTGINKITFNCYKFRSMRMNEEADLKQATEDDPRITKIGKFIRKTNLDELPQFFNVFRGEMSVVGPRPHMLSHTDKYSALIDDYLVRHYVKPGITGWAQINGLRGETDELWKMEKRVELDKEYIRNWSLDWDIVIVWKTIFDLKAFLNAR